MLNFTVGPVQMSDTVRTVGAEQVPYFRTPEFSNIMFENERLIKKFVNAEEQSRVIFLTGSGTASMEATVMNSFNSTDKLLVVNGGSFGKRFAEICEIHEIPYEEISLMVGEALKKEHLDKYDGKDYTGFLVNIDETSTGVLYDIRLISEFCKKNNLYLVVDAISSFLADPLDMKKYGVDVVIIGSQKALACPPGISIMVLSERAVNRINNSKVKSLYFNLKRALKDGERGQTPFTPAVGILRQINTRLREINNNGGWKSEVTKVANIAEDFRNRIVGMPFEIVSESLSNAVTPLHPLNTSAYKIFEVLKNEYNIWVCPNGGEFADRIFRVGHIGNLSVDDNSKLIEALKNMEANGEL